MKAHNKSLNNKSFCEFCKKETKTSIENWCWNCRIGKGDKFACYRCGDNDAKTEEGYCDPCYENHF